MTTTVSAEHVAELKLAIDTTKTYLEMFQRDFAYTAPELLPAGALQAVAVSKAHLDLMEEDYDTCITNSFPPNRLVLALARSLNGVDLT